MSKTYLEAVREALWEELEADPTVFLLGEDIGVYGGAFKVTQGFIEHFGARRIIDTPIAEGGIIGAAIGAALVGLGFVLAGMGGWLLVLLSPVVAKVTKDYFERRAAPRLVAQPVAGELR